MITNSSNMSRFVVKVRVTLLYLAYDSVSLKFDDKRPC
ncbi:glutathione S-transferase [Klebsiella sp. SORGH_AS 1025]|nr:glutathione S-transferase [Klebsiella variicola]MDR6257881.1 glutathione S-transferase [Klebsiella sp. SORGH_AS_0826]MDR6343167.1 glutathione S-transferase [Klebsiella sp. SORGH_AS_1025]MDR6358899.1 glutathione S-transferase [Klebsiella sp. SORGH_AS_1173]MDR6252305.1 glutathione S-transferase [Klebsiella variicola]